MKKLNLLIIFGGCSSEYKVSLESAYSVICNLNQEKYAPILIGITEKGDWYYYTGDSSDIKNDTWQNPETCVPVVISPNQGDRKILILEDNQTRSISVDAAFPVLHGKNGEDGTVQGILELAGIPLAGCGTLASALCMDKDRAHKLAHTTGVRVPESIVFEKDVDREVLDVFIQRVGYPFYVKPVKAGSSFGITKVQKQEELEPAMEAAFQYDNQIIIEENIEGFEVGCAVLGKEDLLVGEVDEIELSSGFFDYTEKYTLKTSAIHVPARISASQAEEIKTKAKQIYRVLGCSGFARVDLFLTPNGEIVFNEVNTIPGFTEHSRYPGMMKAAGYSFCDILDMILEQAVKP